MTIGGIFKAVVPDESDEERRELERYVPFVTVTIDETLTGSLIL